MKTTITSCDICNTLIKEGEEAPSTEISVRDERYETVNGFFVHDLCKACHLEVLKSLRNLKSGFWKPS